MKKDLDKCILNACNSFKSVNKGELPNKIIIYRDGVGEGMREQIMAKEVQQFKEALKPQYNAITSIPDITLVVINKRINQRMFIQSRKGDSVENPPQVVLSIQTLLKTKRTTRALTSSLFLSRLPKAV